MSVVEPGPVNVGPLWRPSLEAQTEPAPRDQHRKFQWLTRLFYAGLEAQISEDRVEEILHQESKYEHAPVSRQLKSLRREYNHFKEHAAVATYRRNAFISLLSGQPLITTFSCHSLLSYWTFRSPENPAKNGRAEVHNDEKIGKWFHQILGHLEENTPRTLQLVVLAEQPSRDDLKGLFSSLRFTIATISGRLDTLHLFPTWAIEVLLAHTWGVEIMPWSPSSGPQNVFEFARPKPLRLPSWGQDASRPGNLDPSRGKNEMMLMWQSNLIPFTSDFAVYIWEYQKSIPPAEYAKVIVCPAELETESSRLVIAFRSCRAHRLFSEKRENRMGTIPANGNGSHWSPMSEVILSIYCVFEVMISDTAKFVDCCHEQASQIHLVGRKNPSTSKLRFLLHLEDRRKAAKSGVAHALEVLPVFVLWARQQGAIEAKEKADALKEDLEFLDQELLKLQVDIEGDQETLRQHFQLEQDLRLFRLTVLAAVFLPLSFTTSLFGMNISTISDNEIDANGTAYFSEWTNATVDSLAPDIQNSTKALVSMIQQSSNLSFSWQTFAITAVSLLFTLPLALFVGAIIRGFILSAAKYAVYWRIIAVIAGIAYIISSIITSAASTLFPLPNGEFDDINSARSSNYATACYVNEDQRAIADPIKYVMEVIVPLFLRWPSFTVSSFCSPRY
ncbi:hypothetical protein F4825DRAFT_453171 [Nemania diffusa]|nr:hypothetical protein F4825DRAFT_453171 [Nemania diffusa]